MNTLMITDLSVLETLDRKTMATVSGGMRKLPFQRAQVGGLLTTPDGDPVVVAVDGVVINSVTDGYVHT